jgi:cytochrome P450
VRIGPNEAHILDSSYYNTLYSNRNRLDKYGWFYSMFGIPETVFATIRADIHKLRRGVLAPFFSTQSAARFNPRVQAHTERLVARMAECAAHDEPIPLFFAYRCLTGDIISEYLFGRDLGLLDRPDWGRSFYSAWRSLWEMSPLIRQLPFILKVFNAMPRWMLAMTQPKALEVIDMHIMCDKLTAEVLASDPEELAKKERPTMLWEVAHEQSLPSSEKTLERLSIEAYNILAAGFETTGGTLAHMTYLILAHPEAYQKLQRELEQAIPDSNDIPSYQTLEKLPYLWAVVKETLRYVVKKTKAICTDRNTSLSGAYSRLPRVNPHESIRYKDWVIPPGCAVGMSALFVELDPTIFPCPHEFKPERWLEEGAKERLEPYLLAFGKGTRMCLGLNLAYAELYSILATMIRRFPKLELWETDASDIEAVADYFFGMWRYKDGKAGLQVKIRS